MRVICLLTKLVSFRRKLTGKKCQGGHFLPRAFRGLPAFTARGLSVPASRLRPPPIPATSDLQVPPLSYNFFLQKKCRLFNFLLYFKHDDYNKISKRRNNRNRLQRKIHPRNVKQRPFRTGQKIQSPRKNMAHSRHPKGFRHINGESV